MNLFLDTETFSLVGPPVCVQYAYDDGPIEIWNFWKNPIIDSLKLIEEFMQHSIIGFNLAFDSFQINKIYNLFLSYPDSTKYPEDIVDDLGMLEAKARDGLCLKPVSACDLLLVARKTAYQKTMERRPIKIKKVPSKLAFELAEYLEKNIVLDPVLFARRKDKLAPKWKVEDIQDDPDFKNVVLRFKASTALKALAADALGADVVRFDEIEVHKVFFPDDNRFAPFATSVGTKGRWNKAWPSIAEHHIAHWEYNEPARKYAKADIDYTRRLYYHFNSPELGDNDSELAWMVGAVRWKGYKINIEGIQELRSKATKKKFEYPTAPRNVKRFLQQVISPEERMILSTKRVVLEEIASWTNQECPFGPCKECNFTGKYTHPAAERARGCLDARMSDKEIDLYNKLLLAGRLHASVNVIGTLSGRMSGTDKLNVQGIKKTKEVRNKFPLAFEGFTLCGGDFLAFEVVLADAVYNDPDLRKQLLTCEDCKDVQFGIGENCPKCGKNKRIKIHALFGMEVYPGMSYDDIKKTSGTSDDKYTRSKSAVFAMLYGGEGYTLQTRLGVDIETADAAYHRFTSRFKRIGIERAKIADMFCSMRQPGGIGSKVEWHEPSEYIESLFGFRRYFTLENRICKELFLLANNPPAKWKNLSIKVRRRADRIQTIGGAVQSALYASAFALQASNMRAAANHVIQSSGASITKHVQRKIWDLQPSGIQKWKVLPLNIHDEIMCPTSPELVEEVAKVVNSTVESFRDKVPLIEMDWSSKLNTWADK
jgi:hypothetical protein